MFKDNMRIERNFEHEVNWRENGLRNLRFEEIKREYGPRVGQPGGTGEVSAREREQVVKVTVELFRQECAEPRVKLSHAKDGRGYFTVEVDETGRNLQGKKWKMPPQKLQCYITASPEAPEREWRKCKKGPAERGEIPDLPQKQSCFWM